MIDDFRHLQEISVRWADQDAFGHVNNAVYFTFFETARIAYLEQFGFWSRSGRPDQGPVLAQIDCNFRRQLQYPVDILVGTGVTRLGHRSFSLSQAIFLDDRDTLIADGDSVIVWFDYRQMKSIELPDALKNTVKKFEGERLSQAKD